MCVARIIQSWVLAVLSLFIVFYRAILIWGKFLYGPGPKGKWILLSLWPGSNLFVLTEEPQSPKAQLWKYAQFLTVSRCINACSWDSMQEGRVALLARRICVAIYINKLDTGQQVCLRVFFVMTDVRVSALYTAQNSNKHTHTHIYIYTYYAYIYTYVQHYTHVQCIIHTNVHTHTHTHTTWWIEATAVIERRVLQYVICNQHKQIRRDFFFNCTPTCWEV